MKTSATFRHNVWVYGEFTDLAALVVSRLY